MLWSRMTGTVLTIYQEKKFKRFYFSFTNVWRKAFNPIRCVYVVSKSPSRDVYKGLFSTTLKIIWNVINDNHSENLINQWLQFIEQSKPKRDTCHVFPCYFILELFLYDKNCLQTRVTNMNASSITKLYEAAYFPGGARQI